MNRDSLSRNKRALRHASSRDSIEDSWKSWAKWWKNIEYSRPRLDKRREEGVEFRSFCRMNAWEKCATFRNRRELYTSSVDDSVVPWKLFVSMRTFMAVVESSGHIPSSPFSDRPPPYVEYQRYEPSARCDFRFSCYNFVFIIYTTWNSTFVIPFRCEDSRGDKKREENEIF